MSLTIPMYIIPIIIAVVVIEFVIIGRTLVATKLDCDISLILKMFLLIPVLMVLMFVELILFAINKG